MICSLFTKPDLSANYVAWESWVMNQSVIGVRVKGAFAVALLVFDPSTSFQLI